MKKLPLITIAVLILISSAFGQKAAAGKVDPAKGVRDAFERLVEGIKQVDVEKVMSVYAKGDGLLIFNNNGTATNGWDNIKSNLEQSYPKIKNVTLDITGLRVEMTGTRSAFVTCKWRQTQENNGTLESAAGRMTLVFALIGKEWKITHRHTSPDRPDATRPVMQSERQP